MSEILSSNGRIFIKDKCGHYGATGTCNGLGNKGGACPTCYSYNGAKKDAGWQETTALPCSVCEGTGWVVKEVT